MMTPHLSRPDLIHDQLIGMGRARKLIFSWGGNPGGGSLHRLHDVDTARPQPPALQEDGREMLEALRDLQARTRRAHGEAA